MDKELIALLALVRAGLWDRYDEAMASAFPLSAESWERVFLLARRQTVTGIAFRGLGYLPDDMAPSMGLMAKWMAHADRIEQSNLAVNEALAKICRQLKDSGDKVVLQKGPGVAIMYPEPLLRECGDIDLFFPENDASSDPLKDIPGATKERKPDGSWEYNVDGVTVEVHSHLVDILSPGAARCVRQLISEKGYDRVSIGGCEVLVPAPEVNLLLLSSHILKHALGVGIGLRQFCDMAVAYRYYADRINPQEMIEIYRKTGLDRWEAVLEDFLSEYLAVVIKLPISEKKRKNYSKKSLILLDIILKGGNFGHFTEKRETASRSVVLRKWHTFTSFIGNMRFAMTYAPGEWFWTMMQLIGGQMR